MGINHMENPDKLNCQQMQPTNMPCMGGADQSHSQLVRNMHTNTYTHDHTSAAAADLLESSKTLGQICEHAGRCCAICWMNRPFWFSDWNLQTSFAGTCSLCSVTTAVCKHFIQAVTFPSLALCNPQNWPQHQYYERAARVALDITITIEQCRCASLRTIEGSGFAVRLYAGQHTHVQGNAISKWTTNPPPYDSALVDAVGHEPIIRIALIMPLMIAMVNTLHANLIVWSTHIFNTSISNDIASHSSSLHIIWLGHRSKPTHIAPTHSAVAHACGL